MSEDRIPVSPDSTGLGPSVETRTFLDDDGNTVHRQVVVLGDPTNGDSVGGIDKVSGALAVVSFAHHEIHEGDSFFADVVDLVMANADTINIVFKTPPGTKRAHMTFGFSTAVGGHVDVLEGPTWNQGTGTAVGIFNRKREATMNSSMLLEDLNQVAFTASDELILNPTGLAGGTTIHDVYAFGAQKVPAGGREENEILLLPDSTYCMCFTADGANNKGQLVLNWYEHTDSA